MASLRNRRAAWWAICALACGLCLTSLAASFAHRENSRSLNEAVSRELQRLQQSISTRITLYQYGLRGLRGAVLTAGDNQVSVKTVANYSKTRDIGTEFPGAKGFGFIQRVPIVEQENFLRRLRAELPSFAIRQLSQHDGERFVIMYVEPKERNAAAIGLDIASEANRREAALASMRSGEPRLTGPITLVQASGEKQQSSLFMMPVYEEFTTPMLVEDRERSLIGWSYAPLSTREILAGIAPDPGHLKVRISDVTNPEQEEVIYEPPGEANDIQSAFQSSSQALFGRLWRVDMTPTVVFAQAQKPIDIRLLLGIGGSFSLLGGVIAALVALQRARRQELIGSQARLATIIENTTDAVIGESLEGKIISWNRAATELFGYNEAEAIGQSLAELLLPPDIRSEDRDLLDRVRRGERIPPFDSCRLSSAGAEIFVAITACPIQDSNGDIVGVAKMMHDITERVSAQQQMHARQQQLEQDIQSRDTELGSTKRTLQAVMDAVPSMIGYWDRDLRCHIANRAHKIWFGVEPEHMVGKHMVELLGPELFEKNLPLVEAVLRGEPQTFERGIVRPDGNGVRQSLAHYIPDADNGEVRGFYVLVHDVTELVESRQRLSAVLRDNRALLQTIDQHFLYSETDPTGTITKINDNLCRLLGYEAHELVGRTHRLIDSGQHESAFWKEMWGTIQSGRTWRGEVCNRSKDGRLVWMDSIVTPFLAQDGSIDRFVAVRVDTTDRKLIDLELNSSHAWLRNVLASATEISIIATDPEGTITIFNAGAERMLGYDADEVVGKVTPAIIHDPNEVQARGEELSTEFGTPVEGFRVFVHKPEIDGAEAHEWTYIRKDGSRLTVMLVVTAIRSSVGAIIGYLGVAQDISGQKEVEHQMLQARQAAEHANVAKGQFLANMSHEIRTPMNAILGMLSLAQKTRLDVRQADYIAKARGSAQSLLGILNDILDLSKVEAGQLELDIHRFELEALLQDLSTVLSGTTTQGPVEVAFHVDPGLPESYMGDSLRIRQVLLNLASNALKFTKSGHVIIHIRRIDADLSMARLRFTVEDSGIGISKDQLQYIFEPFRQAEGSTARRFGGTGLGLSITRSLVGMMGGKLSVDSTPGRGSSFWFELSLPIADDDASSRSTPSPLDVLVVDDNPIIASILADMVAGIGHDVSKASSGMQAIQLAADRYQSGRPFDVVILDWRMPVLDGLETASTIRSMAMKFPDRPAPAMVMITAFGHELLNADGPPFTDNINVTIGKPVTPQQLSNAIYTALHPATESHPDTACASAPVLDGLYLLLVEDNVLNQQVAAELLAGVGARVDIADGGVAGVRMVADNPGKYDAVLMDMQMPDIDGLEATRRIRADPRFAGLPIIAMTANASSSDRDSCLEAGMNDHVGKPIDIDTITAKILQHVDQSIPHKAPALDAQTNRTVKRSLTSLEDTTSISRRLGGRLELLRKLLPDFQSRTIDYLDQISAKIVEEDASALAALFHTIKGSAGAMGLAGLADAVAHWERELLSDEGEAVAALKGNPELVPELKAALADAVAMLLADLPLPVTAAAPSIELDPVSEGDWRSALSRTQHLVKVGNVRCVDELNRIIQLFPKDKIGEIQSVIDLADRYDFVAAAAMIAEILRKE